MRVSNRFSISVKFSLVLRRIRDPGAKPEAAFEAAGCDVIIAGSTDEGKEDVIIVD
jgi:hypothetical protein